MHQTQAGPHFQYTCIGAVRNKWMILIVRFHHQRKISSIHVSFNSFFFFFLRQGFLLCNLSCHGNCSVDQAGLKLRDPIRAFMCPEVKVNRFHEKEFTAHNEPLSSPLNSFYKYFDLNGIRHIFNVEIFFFFAQAGVYPTPLASSV